MLTVRPISSFWKLLSGASGNPESRNEPGEETRPTAKAQRTSFLQPIIIQPINSEVTQDSLNIDVEIDALPRGNLIGHSTKDKSDYLFVAQRNELKVIASYSQPTFTSSSRIAEVSVSPHFANFVAFGDEIGGVLVQNIDTKSPTIRVLPSPLESKQRGIVKLAWHPTKSPFIAAAWEDGLISIWNLYALTKYPILEKLVDAVPTFYRTDLERKQIYVGANNTPVMVNVNVNSDISDIAIHESILIVALESGELQIYNTDTGNLIWKKIDHGLAAGQGKVVVVQDNPFVFTTANRLNNNFNFYTYYVSEKDSRVAFMKVATAAFSPLPLPRFHPGNLVPFGVVRNAVNSSIYVYHPCLSAFWKIAFNSSQADKPFVVTHFGTSFPLSDLIAQQQHGNLLAISNNKLILIDPRTVTNQQTPIISPHISKLKINSIIFSDYPQNLSNHPDTFNTSSPPTTAGSASPPSASVITLAQLKLILEEQKKAFLKVLQQDRLATQDRVLEYFSHLPIQIMDKIGPTMIEFASKYQPVDIDKVSHDVAQSIESPASRAFGSYFTQALIPAYAKACDIMNENIAKELKSATLFHQERLTASATTNTLLPAITELSVANNAISRMLLLAQDGALPNTPQVFAPTSSTKSSSTVQAPSQPITPTASSSTSTAQHSISQPTNAESSHITTPSKKEKRSASRSHSDTGDHSFAVPTPVDSPSGKNVHPTPSRAPQNPLPIPTPPIPVASLPPAAPVQVETYLPIKLESAGQLTPDLHKQITQFAVSKNISGAVDLILQANSVNPLGLLKSRAEIEPQIPTLSALQRYKLLVLITKQGELAKYYGISKALIKGLDVSAMAGEDLPFEADLTRVLEWFNCFPNSPTLAEDVEIIESMKQSLKK